MKEIEAIRAATKVWHEAEEMADISDAVIAFHDVCGPEAMQAVLAHIDAQAAEIERLRAAASAILGSADWRVAGVLSDKSPRRDLPSNAVSTVKIRHLAGLRDAMKEQTP